MKLFLVLVAITFIRPGIGIVASHFYGGAWRVPPAVNFAINALCLILAILACVFIR